MRLLALLLAVPAAAQLRVVAPQVPLTPVVPGLALPSQGISSPVPALPSAPRPTPALPAVAAAPRVFVPGTGPGAAVPVPASKAELDFAAYASAELAALADDLAAENGLRAGAMKGGDFIAVVEAAAARWSAEAGTRAPSPRAVAAGTAAQAGMLRVVRALLTPDQPLNTQVRRLLSVWQVYNQEMTRVAAEKGTLEAVTDEAALFASQVEASV